MMSSDSTVIPTAENENGGSGRTPCPLHGCKRVYTDMSALDSHIKDHEIQAQSLPGKVLLCSTVGCNSSFPNMQKLMEHMRHHHKPNIFFLCESCRTKLRSYRGLLTHLHTCSKVPRGKTKLTDTLPPPTVAVTNANITSMATDQNSQWLGTVSTPQEQPCKNSNTDVSFSAAGPQLDAGAMPLLDPSFLSNLETSPSKFAPQQLAELASQSHLRKEGSDMPLSLNLVSSTAAPGFPDVQGQHQTQTRSSGSATNSPTGSSAVWKKNQGIAYSRRILWEHTKGRYTCVQCGHSVTNRKEMTQHINTQHNGNRPAEDTGSSTSA